MLLGGCFSASGLRIPASRSTRPQEWFPARRGEGCARGYQVVFHRLTIRGAGRDADAGGVNALLGDQVVLGVNGALSVEVFNLGLLVLRGKLLCLAVMSFSLASASPTTTALASA